MGGRGGGFTSARAGCAARTCGLRLAVVCTVLNGELGVQKHRGSGSRLEGQAPDAGHAPHQTAVPTSGGAHVLQRGVRCSPPLARTPPRRTSLPWLPTSCPAITSTDQQQRSGVCTPAVGSSRPARTFRSTRGRHSRRLGSGLRTATISGSLESPNTRSRSSAMPWSLAMNARGSISFFAFWATIWTIHRTGGHDEVPQNWRVRCTSAVAAHQCGKHGATVRAGATVLQLQPRHLPHVSARHEVITGRVGETPAHTTQPESSWSMHTGVSTTNAHGVGRGACFRGEENAGINAPRIRSTCASFGSSNRLTTLPSLIWGGS